MKWVIASGNEGKLREFQAIFAAYGMDIVSKNALGILDEPEENGKTFEENALIKARACAAASGLPTIGDDSGMTVDALSGAPGIYSARYAPPGQRKTRILREMEAVPDGDRGAAFYCAIACVIPGVCEFTVSGACRGIITKEKRGDGGFGYDPIFYLPQYNKTFAELSAETKNKISHRAVALEALRVRLIEMEIIHVDK